jgi:hypothetical protein
MRLEVRELLRIQHARGNAEAIEGLARKTAAGKAFFAAVEKQPPVGAQAMRRPCFDEQAPVFRRREPDQRIQRGSGLLEHAGARAGEKAHGPRKILRKERGVVAKARRGVLQQLRQYRPQPGMIERHQRAACDHPGVAIRGLATRGSAVEQRDLMPSALELQGTRHADDAGAQNGNSVLVHSLDFRRRRGPSQVRNALGLRDGRINQACAGSPLGLGAGANDATPRPW